jgi:hypothetical protein
MKTKKETMEGLLEQTKDAITMSEIKEKYLSRKTVLATSGTQSYQMELGVTQREIKEKKDLVEFLESELKNEV